MRDWTPQIFYTNQREASDKNGNKLHHLVSIYC